MVHYFDRSQFIMADYDSYKQRVVIKLLCMENSQKRNKALRTAARTRGAISVSIDGDIMEYMGRAPDSVALVVVLRKKIGYAELISIAKGIWDEECSDADETHSSSTGSPQPVCCFPVLN